MKREGGVTLRAVAGRRRVRRTCRRAAIATRLVDFVLPAAEIPGKLVELWANARRIGCRRRTTDATGASEAAGMRRRDADEEARAGRHGACCASARGNDFQHYKRATVLRRMERRMQVNAQPDLPAYRDFLQRASAKRRRRCCRTC